MTSFRRTLLQFQPQQLKLQCKFQRATSKFQQHFDVSRYVFTNTVEKCQESHAAPSPRRPTLLFSSSALAERAHKFQTHFPGRVSYAVKANNQPCVLKTLVNCGIHVFDVASCAEIDDVLQVAPDARLHYHNPVKCRDEINYALAKGCRRFVVDHITELDKIDDLVPSFTKKKNEVEIAIRFRLKRIESAEDNAVQDFDMKCGASPSEATQLLIEATSRGYTTGLTFHPGSQCLTSAPHTQHVVAAGQIEKNSNVDLTFLNVGGGFPSRYEDDNPPDVECFFDDISAAAKANLSSQDVLLECEPGRAMVASSFRLQTYIKAVRPDRGEIFLNDGIFGCLMECHYYPEMTPLYKLIRQNNQPSTVDKTVSWIAYGPTPAPVDRLPRPIELPADVQEGDIVEFIGIGAYADSTATRFNGNGDWRTVCVD